ncbi:formate hydrogenlyase transcriptional activator [Myxococcus stipitatus DSM 14675]|uniref:Formate hydrogenlyase transcriptional activator n=1 Tax=Myxococcus stipitatus (strain DSM 14675 / JCM 12634 / Mx s8) TaxID=1278073 RepID=L7UH57_MYXSD|nr:hypothetical protein [Myxococcus stipitatus]AGC48321.1 formate hydrogenlyase transcriptional activator [Myxococcus stipitatus DSM 14675]
MCADALQSISLAMAQVRSLGLLIARIAQGLAAQPDVARVRIWLIAPGDICGA